MVNHIDYVQFAQLTGALDVSPGSTGGHLGNPWRMRIENSTLGQWSSVMRCAEDVPETGGWRVLLECLSLDPIIWNKVNLAPGNPEYTKTFWSKRPKLKINFGSAIMYENVWKGD